jgi:hypothetical protein
MRRPEPDGALYGSLASQGPDERPRVLQSGLLRASSGPSGNPLLRSIRASVRRSGHLTLNEIVSALHPRGGPLPAQDREFWVFGKNIFEAEGEPIGHAVAHHHNSRDRSGLPPSRLQSDPDDRLMLAIAVVAAITFIVSVLGLFFVH